MRQLLIAIVVAACAGDVRAEAFTVSVDAVQNTVREDRLARISLPSGAVDITIVASGMASHGSGAYRSLMVEHKDGPVSVQRAVPIGGSVHLTIGDAISYPLQFYFVDNDPFDNTGAVHVSVSGTVNGSIVVSPSTNCLTDTYAASIAIPPGLYVVAASGAPLFGWGAFATVTLMYSDATGNRYFQDVSMGSSAVWVPSFEGGVVKLFFANTGGHEGGSGYAVVTFSEIGPVRTESRTWGGIKALYRSTNLPNEFS